MAHVDPRREHRRAKMLDHARASVSGGRSGGRGYYARCSQDVRQRRRRAETRQLVGMRDVRCALDVDCTCVICESDGFDLAARRWTDFNGRHSWFCDCSKDHLSPGRRMAARKLEEFDGDFDVWFSWLKRHLPDTLAGRHLLDHLEHVWTQDCSCDWNPKGNYRGCRCADGR